MYECNGIITALKRIKIEFFVGCLILGFVRLAVFRNRNTWNRTQKSFAFTEIHTKIVKHLLKCYFKHIFIIFFSSVRERAEFNKSCNLIGSGGGRNFLIRHAHGGRNPSLGCVSLCDDLKFPFLFLHRIRRLHTEVTFY